MAVDLKNKENVEPVNGEYPYSNIKDDTGANDGTPVNKAVYADFHQFFARLMAIAKVNYPSFNYNNLPENAYDGFQYFEALLKTRPYKVYTAKLTQAGTAAPTATILNDSDTLKPGSTITWTRNSIGQYFGTLTGAFPGAKTWCMLSGLDGASPSVTGFVRIMSDNFIRIDTYDAATGLPQDGSLTDTAIEIRVYP